MSLEIIRNSDGSFALWSTVIDAYVADNLATVRSVGRAAANYFSHSIDSDDDRKRIVDRWTEFAKSDVQVIDREEFESGLVTISVDDLLAASDERSS